jgi:glycosyltransferase involved in cell wall biosynthesis
LPEVGGDAAQYFDPKDGLSIADAVERCLTDDVLREKMITLGKTRASMFTWDNTASQTAAVYRTLVSGKG